MIPVDWLAPLMFGGLVVFMLIGYPVAFSLAAVGLFFGLIGIKLGFFAAQAPKVKGATFADYRHDGNEANQRAERIVEPALRNFER